MATRFKIFVFLTILGTFTPDAFGAVKPSIFRLGVELGYESFDYSETRALQPLMNVNHFKESMLRLNGNLRIALIPRFFELIGEAGSTLVALHVSDSGPAVRLYRLSGGGSIYLHPSIALAGGFSGITMSTPKRTFGFQYMRGTWLQGQFIFNPNSLDTLTSEYSLISRVTFLSDEWVSFNFDNSEKSIKAQAKIPSGPRTFPAFLRQKMWVISLAYTKGAYLFSQSPAVNVEYTDVQLAFGFEW